MRELKNNEKIVKFLTEDENKEAFYKFIIEAFFFLPLAMVVGYMVMLKFFDLILVFNKWADKWVETL